MWVIKKHHSVAAVVRVACRISRLYYEGQMSKINAISMWLGADGPYTRRMVHCPYCGSPLIEINGDIRQIMRGDVQSERQTRGTTIRCKKRLRDVNGYNYSCNTEVSVIDF